MKSGFPVIALLMSFAACDRGQGAVSRPREQARADTTAVTPAPTKSRVLFVGTSLTAGYGLDPDQAYPALIARRIDSLGLNYEVVSAGVSGETSAGARRRVRLSLPAPPGIPRLQTR